MPPHFISGFRLQIPVSFVLFALGSVVICLNPNSVLLVTIYFIAVWKIHEALLLYEEQEQNVDF